MVHKSIAGFLFWTLVCLGNEPKQFHLITFLYPEKKIERSREYCLCLKKNVTHPLISSIDIFFDVEKNRRWDQAQSESHNLLIQTIKNIQKHSIRVNVIEKQGRPTYDDAFQLANKQYQNQYVIIANADIFFNETLNFFNDKKINVNNLFCITRHEIAVDGSLSIWNTLGYSHDAWIFKTPLTIPGTDSVCIGTKHCDGRLVYLAKKQNITCFNPAFYIQCCHVHDSKIRNYQNIPANHKMSQLPPEKWPA